MLWIQKGCKQLLFASTALNLPVEPPWTQVQIWIERVQLADARSFDLGFESTPSLAVFATDVHGLMHFRVLSAIFAKLELHRTSYWAHIL